MKFDELGLHEGIMEGIETMNFKEMTPVQEQTIPIILEGKDLIACAQTGTGKTAAYTLPLLDRLLHEGNPDNVVKSLIVVPTRELAQQIDIQFQGFSYFLPLSTTVVYGGGDGIGWSQQKQGMIMGSDIVIATPGRLLAHIQNSGVDLSHVRYFVLDEARYGILRRYYEDRRRVARPAADRDVLGDASSENQAVGQTNPARSVRGEHRHIQTQRGDQPSGLRMLRKPENRNYPRIVRPAFGDENDYFLVVEAEDQRAGAHAEANEAERRRDAFRSGTGAARSGDARFPQR